MIIPSIGPDHHVARLMVAALRDVNFLSVEITRRLAYLRAGGIDDWSAERFDSYAAHCEGLRRAMFMRKRG